MTEAKAIARYIRMSPRKVRLLANLIAGKQVGFAETQLEIAAKASKGPLLKLLKSAIANAQAKNMARDKLYIKTITVDGGPTLKRFRARAFGRAAPIRKRTSHITIVLATKEN
ncbi:50S ribosomal protein L22 [Candidatus Uhrbacteria bacterium RIFCSPLOWO2_01_FULL_47_24]|uniref:Large ribosomal subunit protein uL22 n=1 Tax=Candidatus Uhrbacteria bacterium RIFCSPLOWO2_01_FULL_47_24 TaxID=1802401 RepID=A0A1F7UV99_9BACT|nr:MAG: 50S ribosomal protein L22 [Candidatus Uhrbacteria bacterium RIFCSPHIGHO2_01_FULL_47_11]OGL68975.1 MAG: 50S ribosomal protein L22 [Candidatus Uhrbacteria bacterium RIFCSPHIGHO2_02_FULL_46_47]OGL74908.1 MAG: 50S ribosomal protein L22 [Candidatus Uhrbacteria bacterium RIFCSPHIGHO2_12_FULL_47_11]OGL81648.1 MAG: 50S ribosomal protein L22 [Candidatus Uhrbacteria bacterium RIFCSPLOWO2_01_FULL_47_24]OGL85099.1 MAG: 50S ribosomal protein L22 [Candidatus Uhrbacteria bacterium RIFCSPLOWO2_02_FULL_